MNVFVMELCTNVSDLVSNQSLMFSSSVSLLAPWTRTQTCCSSTWAAAPASQLWLWETCSNPAPGQLFTPLHLHSSKKENATNPASLPILKCCFYFFLCRLQQLNISWCHFNNNHVKSVVSNLSSSVTHLNLSGYRENLTLDGEWWILL